MALGIGGRIQPWAKLYEALADLPFDLYNEVIFRHGFSLGSNFHKVPCELYIHGTDFHESILYFIDIGHSIIDRTVIRVCLVMLC